MNLLKFTSVILLLITFTFSLQGQTYKKMMEDYTINFYDVIEEADAYFSTIDKTKKGSGWKPFQRWVHTNEYKYYPDGDRSKVDHFLPYREFQSFKRNNPQNSRNLFVNGWNDLGPYSIDSISGHYSAGLGRIEDFEVHPMDNDIIYIGSRSGGLWKTIDGGQTWMFGNTDDLPASGVNTMAVSPTNPDSVLINVRNAQNSTTHGIYRSIDGGATWNVTNFNPTNLGMGGLGDNFRIDEIAIHPTIPNLVFLGTNEGLYRSTDNLNTWTHVLTGDWVTEIVFHPTNPNLVYAYWRGSKNQVMISSDGGATFSGSGIAMGNSNNTTVEISTSSDCPSCLYFGSNNGVWKSTNEGVSFDSISNPNSTCHGYAVSDQDTSVMIYGYVDLYGSYNGGSTFDRITRWSLGSTNGSGSGNQNSFFNSTNYVHADTRDLECVNGVFYVATDGLFCKSTDNGVNWEVLSTNIGVRENYRFGLSQSNLNRSISGSQDNGTSIKLDDTWLEFYGADGMESLIHPLNDDYMMGSVQYGNRRLTKDGGQSQTGASPSGSTGAYWIAPLAYDPNDHMVIYDFRDTLYRSDDFTTSHVQLGTPSFSGDIQQATIAQNNSQIMLVTRGANIEKSTDGGLTFASVRSTLPNYFIEGVAFDPRDDNTFIVVYGRYQNDGNKVYITTDGGVNYTNITANLGNMPIRSVVIDHTPDRNIYLGAEIGIYTKKMSDTNWSLYNQNFPNVSARELEINYGANVIKTATWGRGLWENNLVGRENYPSIVHTTITHPPTEPDGGILPVPKATVDQIVQSKIHYTGTLSSVFVTWSLDNINLNHTVTMTNVSDSTWVADSALPNTPVGSQVYFKVFAVGANMDTTETYRFNYRLRDAVFCDATGNQSSGNLFIDDVTVGSYTNTSNNDAYTFYDNNPIFLKQGSSTPITVSANTGWSQNDHAVWVDFNKDLDFTSDEIVIFDPETGSESNGIITIAESYGIGDTLRMRVRLKYFGTDIDPCGTNFGEVEDYMIIVEENCNLVTNTNDSGQGSLREAIQCSNAGDTITFSSILNDAVIGITTTTLRISKEVAIVADTAQHIVVRALDPNDSNLEHLWQNGVNGKTLLEGFKTEGAFGLEGSVIDNYGELTLKLMTLTNNGKTDIVSTIRNTENATITVLKENSLEVD